MAKPVDVEIEFGSDILSLMDLIKEMLELVPDHRINEADEIVKKVSDVMAGMLRDDR